VIKDLRAGDPASVGPYRMLGRLGAGGMGEVYLAKSPGGRLVAIKLIRPELAEERGFRARFASEISAARNVSGIYTAAVVDADAEAELPWMATVYVAGPSLTDAVEENGPLPVRSVLALAAGLAEALQAIHRAGLVHRDLKPSNVLLATDGPRVIDFGISLALERSMMTATGMVMGSPGFMSPEQARGQRVIGAPTDMFSLGAVLAFAATGNGPFGAGPSTALLYRVVNEPPDLAAVPARLKPLIEHCLAKDPADRPTSAEVLASVGDVDVLTGEWLPQPIAETMVRYMPTLHTPLPPALREAGQPAEAEPMSAGSAPAVPAESASAAASLPLAGPATPAPQDPAHAASEPVGYEPTVLAPVIPAQGASETAVSAWSGAGPAAPATPAVTRAEHGLLPATALVPVSDAVTAVGRNIPGGTGGPPPAGPPSPFRRWRWPIAAAVAAVAVIAVVAVLLTSHSSGGAPKGGTPTASLAGNATKPPATPTKTHSTKPTQRPTTTPTSQSPVSNPATQSSATASTSTSSPTPTATSSPTAKATPTSSTSPTTAPTAISTSTAPTTSPAQPPTSNPATTSPTQSATG
jgi:eukaryotic-like serine/threonine-protein kinase